MRTAFIATVVCILLLTTCCYQPKNSSVRQKQAPINKGQHETDHQFEKREALFKKWMNDLKHFVLEVRDKEATKLYEFLRSAVLAAPGKNSVYLNGAHVRGQLVIVLMLQSDKDFGPLWESVQKAPGPATFISELKVIAVKNYPLPPVARSIILLHETHHAYRHMVEKRISHSLKDTCQDEVEAHVFQNRLATKYFGKPYKDLISSEIKKIRRVLKKQNTTIDETVVTYYKYEKGLDKVFGKTQNPYERAFRITFLMMHVNFAIIDLDSKDDKNLQKRKVINSAYSSSGVMRKAKKGELK